MLIHPETRPVHPKAMYNPDFPILVPQITKVASSTWRAIPGINQTNNWAHIDITERTDISRDTKTVIILREPHDRFVSAANMIFRTTSDLLWKHWRAENYLIDDIHFRNQADFVINYAEFTDIDYWYYHPHVNEDIINHYDLGINYKSWGRWNGKTEDIFRWINPDWIEDKYRRDYELINSVTFVNK